MSSRLSPTIRKKLDRLHKKLRTLGRVAVAFSGGVDSSFLLAAAVRALGKDNVTAITALSPVFPSGEARRSAVFACRLGVKRETVRARLFADRRFVANPVSRCYVCKKKLFGMIREKARRRGIDAVLDASTFSDRADVRPGTRALKELGIHSPLDAAGFTKEEVRRVSRAWGLSTWNSPSAACLASRVPYGTALTPALMRRIEHAEQALRRLGFGQVRVRHYGLLCRLEVERAAIGRAFERREEIVRALKKNGYAYVTVDLEGFRSGSMNDAG